jgi:Na+/H+ antiporter NhaC
MGRMGDFNNRNFGNMNFEQSENQVYYYTMIILVVLLIIAVIITLIFAKKGSFKMKGKVLTLIIGILIGAIIATAGFLIYNNVTKDSNQPEMMQMDNNGQMKDFSGGENSDSETPPSKPDGEDDNGQFQKNTKTNTTSNT